MGKKWSKEQSSYLWHKLHLCPGRHTPEQLEAIADYIDAGNSIYDFETKNPPRNISVSVKTFRKIYRLYGAGKLDWVLGRDENKPDDLDKEAFMVVVRGAYQLAFRGYLNRDFPFTKLIKDYYVYAREQ